MRREQLGDLTAFLAVAEERSFTRAAAKLGTSQAAASQAVRRLEERLGVRLLATTTRSVTPVEAGERLQSAARPALDQIEHQMRALAEYGGKVSGTIRLAAPEDAAYAIIWPVLSRLLAEYPDVHVELSLDTGLTDIVAKGFDAGVRLGESVARDMVAVRIGPDLRMAVVGAPGYFARHPKPRTPQDLAHHRCINLRLPTAGGLYAWELEKGDRELRVRVDGQLTFNNPRMIVRAAKEGFGLACMPEDMFARELGEGSLVRVLEDWCPTFPGYHLYYPSRRQHTPAFVLLLEALRYRRPATSPSSDNRGDK